MLRDQPHRAGVAEQVGTDLAFIEVAQEDYVDAAWRRRDRFVLRIDSGSLRRSLPSLTGDVEIVKLQLSIVLAGMQAVEVRPAATPSSTASPSITKDE
jgi:hypothetical protein